MHMPMQYFNTFENTTVYLAFQTRACPASPDPAPIAQRPRHPESRPRQPHRSEARAGDPPRRRRCERRLGASDLPLPSGYQSARRRVPTRREAKMAIWRPAMGCVKNSTPIFHARSWGGEAAESGLPCGNLASVLCIACSKESSEPSGSVRNHRRAKVQFQGARGLGSGLRAGLAGTTSTTLRPCAIFARLSTSYILPRLARTARCSQGPPEAASYNLGSGCYVTVTSYLEARRCALLRPRCAARFVALEWSLKEVGRKPPPTTQRQFSLFSADRPFY